MYDVVIIGAGVVGAMTARVLSRYDLSVCVVDKESDVAMGATRANSAIVHAGYDAEEGSLKAKLNVKGSKMMPKIAGELGVSYRNNGSLVIGFTDDDKTQIQQLYQRGIKNGVENLSILNKQQLLDLEPNLSKNAVCALSAPTGAIVCPYELTIAAMGNAMDNHVDLKLNFEVTGIETRSDSYCLQSCGESITTRYVVNAAGLYGDKIAAMIGDTSIAIRPRKGEYLLLDKTAGSIVSHTIFRTPDKKGKGILVSPTVDGNLLLGPTSENIADKTDVSTTSEGLKKIIDDAKRISDIIPLHQVITSFSGLRAAGNTGDFIITMSAERWLNLAGIESPGLSAAPAIAEYAAEMLASAGLYLKEKTDFEPKRKSMGFFRRLSQKEKNRLIQENSAYGKIICRCENVSEGEILDAIHTHPKATTIDGIKRRTRSGMGRCQGGFCSPSVLELLARELQVPIEAVTKSGPGSALILGRTKGGESR